MQLNGGAAALAAPLRKLYAPLFEASHTPYKEPLETLKNLFNIHSGGSSTTLEFQVQTFKALAESTVFEEQPVNKHDPAPSALQTYVVGNKGPASRNLPVHIDIHIHLPENKSRRDYEAIIEDIGQYILGKTNPGLSDE